MERCKKWEDLNLSRDEVKSIGEALEKEEFRNLLLDYVKEINDPENRKQYEKEIAQLENERGVDVKFVHPSSGYVIKTSADGIGKIFINVCSNSNVGKPTSTPSVDDGHRGLCWSIPHCLAPPREDVDKKNNLCTVYDVVFHPETLQLAKNDAFKKLVNDTAVGAVEESYHVCLDRVNLRFPKMNFKGAKHATVIRKRIDNFKENTAEFTDIPNYPYPSLTEKIEPVESIKKRFNDDSNKMSKENSKYTTPKYTVKYRNNLNMQDFTNDPMAKLSILVPTELVIVVDLPLLRRASDVSIDVKEKSFSLISENPAKYKLMFNTPYKVDSSKGSAKFDTVKKTLTVTLPVSSEKHNLNNKSYSRREDSGVDSDKSHERSNSSSSTGSDEDGVKNDSDDTSDQFKGIFDQISCNKDESKVVSHKFLKSDIHYIRPSFNCQLVKDVINITLEVPNVNPESVEYCFIEKPKSSGFQMSFISTGCGFFPVNYAICFLIPSPIQANKESFKVEVWDNNVIVQIKITPLNGLKQSSFYIGSDESNVEKILLVAQESMEFSINNDKLDLNTFGDTLKEKNEYISHSNKRKETKGKGNVDQIVPDLQTQDLHFTNDENHHSDEVDVLLQEINKNKDHECEKRDLEEGEDPVFDSGSSFDDDDSSPHRQNAKSRTQSESQQEENMEGKNRGILKIRRSLSESSVDNYASWSEEKMEKTKKTVRFSDVISKQTFRMNSSILGQRKKNQRKMKNKKRAQERRLSESGNESEGDNENLSKGKQFLDKNKLELWMAEAESSSCDVSEVSEISDISESDDGLKEDSKLFTPCSSKKNHKRRGKKSARKNAATAKMQYIEN